MYHVGEIPDQEPNEKLILFLRRDLFILFKIVVLYLFLLLIPLLMSLAFSLVGLQFNGVMEIVVTLLVFSYYLFVLVMFYRAFLDYYLDIWIVTTERIITIEQKDLFNRVISELRLFRIQDVTSESSGFFATFFNYGNVHVQTAAEQKRFEFVQVPDSHGVAKVIANLVERKRLRGDWRMHLGDG